MEPRASFGVHVVFAEVAGKACSWHDKCGIWHRVPLVREEPRSHIESLTGDSKERLI